MSNITEVKQQVDKQKVVTVFDFMQQNRDLIARALPASITPDRLIGVFTMVLRSSPELAVCSQSSLIAAVIQTVQLGLTPGNIGHCHYIPFNNKQKDGSYRREVQFIIGYKGIIELVNRCGKASILSTEVVYTNDRFEYELGLTPTLKHQPTSGERGEIFGVYCVAKNLVANEKIFVYLTRADIDKVRNSSKAGQSEYSPWNNWFEEMAKKTVIKRICKLLPLSVEDQKKIATDETIKTTIAPDMTDVKSETEFEPAQVEDAEIIDKQPSEQPKEPDNVSRETSQNNQQPNNIISVPQGKRFYAIAKTAGYSDDEIHQHLSWKFNLESSRNITKDRYEEICKYFEKKQP